MKKIKTIALACGIVMCASATMPLLTGCGAKISNETTPLVFSSQEFDGVFNSFYSTNASDSEIAGMTQISMLSADADGKVACGDAEPVVVKDYNTVMYDKNGNISTDGDKDGKTVYQFIIKKGIKFSDGQDLTIKDVLFSLYTYLDPVYTGSSTIYSTDIQGLAKYRLQNPLATGDISDAESGFEEGFQQSAEDRIADLVDYLDGKYTPAADELVRIQKDIETVKKEFKNELTSDWNTCSDQIESYQKEYKLQYGGQEWEIFCIMEGMITVEKNSLGYPKKENGLKLLDYAGINYQGKTKEEVINEVYNSVIFNDAAVADVVTGGWATAGTIKTLFAAEAKAKYFDELKEENGGKLIVPNIEGIQALKGDQYLGDGDYDDYDMLQITINGVDPKAIWNFGFTVAPLHYYSGTYKGENYVELAKTEKDNFGVCFGDINFYETVVKAKNSVPMGAGMYKASTLQSSRKSKSYDASDAEGFKELKDGFFKDNIVYFERNDYFKTVMNPGQNCKIKYVRYKVVSANNIMNALLSKNTKNQIHYADPSATPANITAIDKCNHLSRQQITTNGYGYIGLNARYINDIYVRRAIMSTFNAELVKSYYPSGSVDTITRPITKNSWVNNAYEEAGIPELNEVTAPPVYPYDKDFNTGKKILEDAGYTYDQANKQWSLRGQACDLTYTFTIAGDSMDHPAYQVMYNASKILNANGFNITVKTSANALRDLASGTLTCWAAAWSSTIDPDMYQVYHKNSKASSVRAWGYDYMITEGNGSSEELKIIRELSDLIDAGRETLKESERTAIYRDALDLIMDLAVEFPLYQRRDMYVYNTNIIDVNTLNDRCTAYSGPMSRLWEIGLNESK